MTQKQGDAIAQFRQLYDVMQSIRVPMGPRIRVPMGPRVRVPMGPRMSWQIVRTVAPDLAVRFDADKFLSS
jgi:hypothetical protein